MRMAMIKWFKNEKFILRLQIAIDFRTENTVNGINYMAVDDLSTIEYIRNFSSLMPMHCDDHIHSISFI